MTPARGAREVSGSIPPARDLTHTIGSKQHTSRCSFDCRDEMSAAPISVQTTAMTHASARTAPGGRIFQRFKYGIYFLLALDILLFLWQEWLAAAHTFADGVSAGDLVNAFTATIDTAAWVVLLLVFELETSQIPPERLTGRLRWALHGVRAFCYVFIVFAFYGYILQCNSLYDVSTIAVAEVCSLADTGASYLVTLDEFAAITTAISSTAILTILFRPELFRDVELFEKLPLDVAAGMKYLSGQGYEKTVLVGLSASGPRLSFYQDLAENREERVNGVGSIHPTSGDAALLVTIRRS